MEMMETARLSQPQPLQASHETGSFSCNEPVLDSWLKQRALKNQISGASRTYAVLQGRNVAAYYSLASESVSPGVVAGSFRRNMPDPIPIVVLARLAVDTQFHGKGLGRALVRDAMLRVTAASEIIGIRGVLVHALTPDARNFYLAVGFQASPIETFMLFARLDDVKALMQK